MTEKNNNNPRLWSKQFSFPDPVQRREQARQKATAIPLPDPDTMTREEIHQMIHELYVKQIEADLQMEHLRSELEKKDDQASLFRIVNENMLDMVALTDMEGNFTFAGNVHRILGYEPGCLIGKNVMDFVHPEDFPYIMEELGELISSGLPRKVEYRYKRADDSYLWLETLGKIITDENGIAQTIVFNARDTTERQHAREALQASQEKYRTILENIEDGYFEVDLAGNFTFFNDSMCRILGYSSNELMGMNYSVGMDKETVDKVYNLYNQVFKTGKPLKASEWEFIKKDGEKCFVSASVSLIKHANGEAIGFRGIARDITERKRTEEKLKRRELTLNKIFDLLPIGLWFVDKNGRLIKGNPAGVKIWGAEPTVPMKDYGMFKARRLPGREEIAPDDWALAHTINNGATITDELLEIDAFDGRKKIILNYTAPVIDDAGGMLGAIVVNNDITVLWQAEEKLRESEARYRELVENTNSIILKMDTEGRITFLNDFAQSFFGYDARELIGRNVIGTIVPERDASGKDLRTMITDIGKRPERYILNENENMKKDGTRVWICWSNKAVLDCDGNVREILCVGNDATPRRKAEQLLQKSEKRVKAKLDAVLRPEGDIGMLSLADILDTEAIQDLMNEFYSLTRIGGAIVDLDGNVLVSTGWQDICTMFHRVHPESSKNCLESDTIFSTGSTPGQFKAYRCKNNMWDVATPIVIGDKHFGSIFLGQFFYEDQKIDYKTFRAQARKYGFDEQLYMEALDRVPRFNRKLVETAMKYYARLAEIIATLSYSNLKLARTLEEYKRNEKEREKLQAQLNQAQKMESVGRLAGGVAHDFNNKLTIINSYAEMAIDMLDPSDPVRDTIHEVHTAAQQSADIVRQLLAFARKQIISPEPLDLNDTLSAMLKMLQRLIGENIDLAWHPGKNLWPIKIDPTQVDQIMANLATNARDAISDVGKLTIETKNTVVDEDYCKTNPDAMPGRYVMLAVHDDGCGMEKDVMDQLFEPYFTTKDVGKGTGLGLPTIYGIVKQNNGFLNVFSEPGEGTTFEIHLPAHEAKIAAVPAAEEFSGNIPGGAETILIVEDEKALLQATRRILERRGYTILIAESPGEALTYCNEYDGTIDLLLTDVVMPDMNGRDLASQMTMSRPGLKTLYMSGYTANSIAHHGVLDEGVLFIQKPFSMRDLAAKVREAIAQE